MLPTTDDLKGHESLPERLHALLQDTTKVLRKNGDPVVSERQVDRLQVIEILGDPTAEETTLEDDTATVDLIFVDVAVDRKKAAAQQAVFKELVEAYPQPARLAQGPSYIEIAGVLGIEQETAFRFMALGEVLGFWQVVSGTTLGMGTDQAKQMAGRMGFPMVSGLKKPE